MSVIDIVLCMILVVFLGLKLKSVYGEINIMLSLGTCLFITYAVITRLNILIQYISRITSAINLDIQYIGIIVKMLAVSYICQLGSAVCRDASYTAIAVQIDIIGRISMVLIGMPVIMGVVELLSKLIA